MWQVVDWAPQNDILGHPRTRAFMSHCGVNSLYEVGSQAAPAACAFRSKLTAACNVLQVLPGLLSGAFSMKPPERGLWWCAWMCLTRINMRVGQQQVCMITCRRRTTAFPSWRCPSPETSPATPAKPLQGWARKYQIPGRKQPPNLHQNNTLDLHQTIYAPFGPCCTAALC